MRYFLIGFLILALIFPFACFGWAILARSYPGDLTIAWLASVVAAGFLLNSGRSGVPPRRSEP